MRIVYINDEKVEFDNGNRLTYDHCSDYCECNYADWEYLEEEMNGIIFDIDFDENLVFEKNDYGFRFGNPGKMFFVPCYSEQNGYYSSDVDIYYKTSVETKLVLSVDCDIIRE